MTHPDPKALARRAIACLDLTDLNDDCSDAGIVDLCARAATGHGDTAAVRIWPRFVALAKQKLGNSAIRIATVVNYPHGGEDTASVVAETGEAIADDADEIDMVMAYRLVADRVADTRTQIAAIRETARGRVLKVILETGEPRDAALYFGLSDEILGPDRASPQTFRIGASGILDELVAPLDERGLKRR